MNYVFIFLIKYNANVSLFQIRNHSIHQFLIFYLFYFIFTDQINSLHKSYNFISFPFLYLLFPSIIYAFKSSANIFHSHFSSINQELWLIGRYKLIVQHILIVQGVESRAEHFIFITQARNLFLHNFITKVPAQTLIHQVTEFCSNLLFHSALKGFDEFVVGQTGFFHIFQKYLEVIDDGLFSEFLLN